MGACMDRRVQVVYRCKARVPRQPTAYIYYLSTFFNVLSVILFALSPFILPASRSYLHSYLLCPLRLLVYLAQLDYMFRYS